MKTQQDMIRAPGGLLSIEEVLPHVVARQQPRVEHEFLGHLVHMDSPRYRNFVKNGTNCIRCGLKGLYFAIERHKNSKDSNPDRYHLNLYGVDREGVEVLMTVDHIIPASRGGRRHSSNLQTMCTICNTQKANLSDEADKGRVQVLDQLRQAVLSVSDEDEVTRRLAMIRDGEFEELFKDVRS